MVVKSSSDPHPTLVGDSPIDDAAPRARNYDLMAGDKIVSMVNFNGIVIVATENRIYKLGMRFGELVALPIEIVLGDE